MRNSIKRYCCIILLVLCQSICTIYAHPSDFKEEAQDTSRTFVFYFRFNRSLLEKEYMTNKQSMDTLGAIITRPDMLAHLDSIVIKASASPEGAWQRNRQLAAERAAAVKSYLMWQYPYLDRNKILTYSLGEDWEGLKQMVEADMYVPYREEVLNIINSDLPVWSKDRRIQQLGNGAAFQYMVQHMLRYLRAGATCIVFYKKTEDKTPAPVEIATYEENIEDTIQEIPVIETTPAEKIAAYKRPIALKTNLLFDLATALNIELEVPLGRRFSVAGEWMSPWWLWQDKQHSFEVMLITLEGRYWLKPLYRKQEKALGNHNPLTGWFVGLYSSMGKYDLEREKKGYQGEVYLSTGLTIGYTLPLWRNVSMEFSLSAGYLQSNYRYYHARQNALGDWHLYKQYPGSFKWVGPTKAKVSWVWYPHFKSSKKGGGR